jgi:hypothetical protein
MSAAARMTGFVMVLLLTLGVAALAGEALGPDRDAEGERAAGHADEAGHAGESGHAGAEAGAAGSAGATDAVRGLAVADEALKLLLRRTELRPGRPGELRFAIAGGDGRRVRDFEVEHTKRMHLIVVRRDGRGFQHLHPELGADGEWSTPLTLPEPGAYRVFADFKRGAKAHTLAGDLFVDGDASYRPLPEPAATATTATGYDVRLDAGGVRAGEPAELRFSVTRDGRAVRTEPYLGAGGHLVALREGDLAYLHVHPAGHDEPAAHGESAAHDAIAFETGFPSAGRYRLYLQFKDDGRVHTAEFTQEVTR